MDAKRRRLSLDQDGDTDATDRRNHPAKRLRIVRRGEDEVVSPRELSPTTVSQETFSLDSPFLVRVKSHRRDVISSLPNELIIRILSYLSENQLLRVSPVSKHFSHLAADSQLWRAHYYRRFILPRAHRIPGFRASTRRSDNKLYYNSQRSIWADGGFGRRGGLVEKDEFGSGLLDLANTVDWKREYKIQHNWSKGQCAVEEVQVHNTPEEDAAEGESIPAGCNNTHGANRPAQRTPSKTTMPIFGTRTMVKVIDGIAVTVDWTWGLRAWDLRTRRLRAQICLETEEGLDIQPTALAMDDQLLTSGLLDLAIGFEDGSFGVWRYDSKAGELSLLHRHDKASTGKLIAVAYRYPYLFAATPRGFITLYSLGISPADVLPTADGDDRSSTTSGIGSPASGTVHESEAEDTSEPHAQLYSPQVLTSLKSQHTRQPLALSIRAAASSVVASIAYSFDSWNGWCIGIQDFDIRPSAGAKPEVLTSRVAYTLPTTTRRPTGSPSSRSSLTSPLLPGSTGSQSGLDDGPTRLSYSHPYLLATLPDNTLALHICTTTSETLHISDAVRLWGHTSGISDAEITPRGKAVSVSTRGEELRVWELEGRSATGRARGGSVEIRPRQQLQQQWPRTPRKSRSLGDASLLSDEKRTAGPELAEASDEKRDWVGFDDEMVIVLKSTPTGKESLVIYDFT